jgi:hypothetical protein
MTRGPDAVVSWVRRARPSTVRWIVTGLLVVPFVIAAVALRSRGWYPVLDLAMTEFRVRDVGTRHTPLIGLPGRIGNFPDQGSHPGPLSFYALAPTYRLFGASSWALQVATIVVAVVLVGLLLWILQRQSGTRGVVVGALIVLVALRGYGIDTIAQPWNPYLPLLAWLVVLASTWAIMCGDHRMLMVFVVVGSFAAQTHLPYLGLVGGLIALVVFGLVFTWRRRPLQHNDMREGGMLAVTAGLLVWLPVVLDQVRNEPGNVRRLVDYFRDSPEDPVGLGEGVQLALRHLDPLRVVGGMFSGDGHLVRAGFRLDGSILPGLVLLLAFAATAVLAWRRRHGRLIWLHAVGGWTFVLAVISMSRIFGKVWFYLTLWAWMLPVLMVWTVWVELRARERLRPEVHRAGGLALLGVCALLFVVFTVETFGARPAEPHLSETLGELIEPTMQALEDGVGEATSLDGTYMVTWTDAANFGSQGYGLINELERRGVEAGVAPAWRVPVTPHRVLDAGRVTAELHLATGGFIDQWRADARAVEIATYEPRDADEMVRFEALRTELTDGLTGLGLGDLVPLVDTNLFGVQLDPRVPPRLQEITDDMLELGQLTAVFVLPAGTTQ